MWISTKGCYALRAMIDLAGHASGKPVVRQEIAARQGISASYMAQLFRQLRQAQLVKAFKGPGGGYMLARDPATISVGDVLRAMEGSLAISQCVMPGKHAHCRRAASCTVRPLLEHLTTALTKIVEDVSLQDLCHQADSGPKRAKQSLLQGSKRTRKDTGQGFPIPS